MKTSHVHDGPVAPERPSTGDGGGVLPPLEEWFNLDEGPMRRDLMRQITALEEAMSQFVVQQAPFERLPPRPLRGPAILSSADLEDVRDELLAQLNSLRDRAADRFAERLLADALVKPRRGPFARRREDAGK